MHNLFSAIREASSKTVWSKGVSLSRQDSVSSNLLTPEEAILKVKVSGRAVSPTVKLWPIDEDWNCDCLSPNDPCEHVVAAAIKLKQAQESNTPIPPSAKNAYSVYYAFTAKKGQLKLERHIVKDGKQITLPSSATAIVNKRVPFYELSVSKEELEVDLILANHRRESGSMLWSKVIALLEGNEHVTFNATSIACLKKKLGFIVTVKDSGAGLTVETSIDHDISEVFHGGACLSKQFKLLPTFGSLESPPKGTEEFVKKQYFGPKEFNYLASELIPKLKDLAPVKLATNRLPTAKTAKPCINWDFYENAQVLYATPSLAYGFPSPAVIQDGKLKLKGRFCPIRNHNLEKKLEERFQNAFKNPLGQRMVLKGEEKFNFYKDLQVFDSNAIKQLPGSYEHQGPLSFKALPTGDGNKVDFSFVVDNQQHSQLKADAKHILSAWKNNESMIQLSEGGWASIPSNWLQRYGKILSDLVSAKESTGEIPNCLIPSLIEVSSFDERHQQSNSNIRRFFQEFKTIVDSPAPLDLKAKLRPYQRQGISWLNHLKHKEVGALLADDMGLGKTLQAICTIEKTTIVICPSSVLFNWRKEINSFRPILKVQIYHGPNRSLNVSYDVLLTTYAVLRLDYEKICRKQWQVCILDEAQFIKNNKSQSAQACYAIDAKFRLALSGTPIENSHSDLWSIFHFLNPSLLGSKQGFQENLSNNNIQEFQLSLLKRRVSPFILRRLKADVAKDLPPRTDIVLESNLSETERETYEAIKLSTRDQVMSKVAGGQQTLKILEALLRLRQSACHQGLLPNSQTLESSKLELLISCLSQYPGTDHKVLIFSQWTSFLDLISDRLSKDSYEHLRIDGSSSNRQSIVDSFQCPQGPQILLLSLKAAGVGLNLTAADHVYLMDPWWNPAVENQAADRAHRIGQTKPVMVYKLIAKDTVEEKILTMQSQKQSLVKSIMEQQGTYQFNKEDLMSLLT